MDAVRRAWCQRAILGDGLHGGAFDDDRRTWARSQGRRLPAPPERPGTGLEEQRPQDGLRRPRRAGEQGSSFRQGRSESACLKGLHGRAKRLGRPSGFGAPPRRTDDQADDAQRVFCCGSGSCEQRRPSAGRLQRARRTRRPAATLIAWARSGPAHVRGKSSESAPRTAGSRAWRPTAELGLGIRSGGCCGTVNRSRG